MYCIVCIHVHTIKLLCKLSFMVSFCLWITLWSLQGLSVVYPSTMQWVITLYQIEIQVLFFLKNKTKVNTTSDSFLWHSIFLQNPTEITVVPKFESFLDFCVATKRNASQFKVWTIKNDFSWLAFILLKPLFSYYKTK